MFSFFMAIEGILLPPLTLFFLFQNAILIPRLNDKILNKSIREL